MLNRVLMSSPAVPIEIIRAAGLRPEVARSWSLATPAADAHLEPGIFPHRLRHLVDAALTGSLADCVAIVLPRTSDVDYKCFLYLREFVRRGVARELPPVLLFDLLQSRGSDAREYDVCRTRALAEHLASLSGRPSSPDALRHEITRANAARQAARRLISLRSLVPRVAGAEVFPLLSAFWETDPDRYAATTDEAARDIATRPPLTGARVLLTGAPVDVASLHDAIESHGAIVVAEAGPWGSGVAGDEVRADGDPMSALADKYRVDTYGARTPIQTIRCRTEQMLDGVDAVVVVLPPDDAVFGWDYPNLRDRLNARRIPHVCLRADPCAPLSPSDHERLDAMIAAASGRLEARHG